MFVPVSVGSAIAVPEILPLPPVTVLLLDPGVAVVPDPPTDPSLDTVPAPAPAPLVVVVPVSVPAPLVVVVPGPPIDLLALVNTGPPVAVLEPLEPLIKLKLIPALAVPPGRGFGVLVQEDTGGALET